MQEHLLGIISDTHGLLRSAALRALERVELIVHAGDIGSPEVLAGLQHVAPVKAVRGNVDREAWALRLPMTDVVEIDGVRLYVLHDLGMLDLDPAAAGCDVVVTGHSHKASCFRKSGVLWLNPGSAGPRRFSNPVTLARLKIVEGRMEAEIVDLGE